jgi:hypothetical protein
MAQDANTRRQGDVIIDADMAPMRPIQAPAVADVHVPADSNSVRQQWGSA